MDGTAPAGSAVRPPPHGGLGVARSLFSCLEAGLGLPSICTGTGRGAGGPANPQGPLIKTGCTDVKETKAAGHRLKVRRQMRRGGARDGTVHLGSQTRVPRCWFRGGRALSQFLCPGPSGGACRLSATPGSILGLGAQSWGEGHHARCWQTLQCSALRGPVKVTDVPGEVWDGDIQKSRMSPG